MENLTIENTKSTPKVIGNTETGNLTLSGNLFPENSIIFFKPIYSWITDLSKQNNSCKNNYIFCFVISVKLKWK